VPRASKTAPDVGFHFDHSRKPNRPKYIWGQGWVTLAAVVPAETLATSWAVPLISRLVRKTGKHGKLTCARVLLRVVRGLFGPSTSSGGPPAARRLVHARFGDHLRP